jgi:3-oxoacyl-[acyl-carrier-protein] synthase II
VRAGRIRHVGETLAGVCDFDALRAPDEEGGARAARAPARSPSIARTRRSPTRARERSTPGPLRPAADRRVPRHHRARQRRDRDQIHEVAKYAFDLSFWSHHHNPRTVANNPAGEVTLNLGITGPAYCLGGACAAGNLGLIHGCSSCARMVDVALGGGVSESIHTFGIFASFARRARSRSTPIPRAPRGPFDRARNGIVVSEGGCLFALERLDGRARARRAHPRRAARLLRQLRRQPTSCCRARRPDACMRGALAHARLARRRDRPRHTHATSTPQGDESRRASVRGVRRLATTLVNNTKSFIGHAMGAAGALELAGNLPSFRRPVVHPRINLDDLDPACELEPRRQRRPRAIARHAS